MFSYELIFFSFHEKNINLHHIVNESNIGDKYIYTRF
jgi:hypothetical protein